MSPRCVPAWVILIRSLCDSSRDFVSAAGPGPPAETVSSDGADPARHAPHGRARPPGPPAEPGPLESNGATTAAGSAGWHLRTERGRPSELSSAGARPAHTVSHRRGLSAERPRSSALSNSPSGVFVARWPATWPGAALGPLGWARPAEPSRILGILEQASPTTIPGPLGREEARAWRPPYFSARPSTNLIRRPPSEEKAVRPRRMTGGVLHASIMLNRCAGCRTRAARVQRGAANQAITCSSRTSVAETQSCQSTDR